MLKCKHKNAGFLLGQSNIVRYVTFFVITSVILSPLEPVFAQSEDASAQTGDASAAVASPSDTSTPNVDASVGSDTVNSSASPSIDSTDSTSAPDTSNTSNPTNILPDTPTTLPTGNAPPPSPPPPGPPPPSNPTTPENFNTQTIAYSSFGQDHLTVDKNTGALTLTYPITVPPGRNNFQPNVDLTYNSQDTRFGNIIGEGWSINIPYIERLNKTGVDTLYSTSTSTPTYFRSYFDGELATTTASSTYIPRTENGTFNSYSFSNNRWVVTDKNGTQFVFGSSTASRQTDPNNSSTIFRWMLQEVRDTNNNLISYSYFKDSGQIYPSSTSYTNTATSTGIFQIDFLRESRGDHATSSNTGFAVSTNYRINEIDAKVSGSLVRKYALAYTTGDNVSTTLLSSVTETGWNASGTSVSLPAVSFAYQTQTAGWTSSSTWNSPLAFLNWHDNHNNGVLIADVNGDNLSDIIQGISGVSTNTYAAYLNNGRGWTASSTWLPPADAPFWNPSTSGDNGVRVVDVNGDGLSDVLLGSSNISTTTYEAWINNGHGWVSSSTWNPPVSFLSPTGQNNGALIADVNGDGLPDIIQGDSSLSTTTYAAYLNNGHGWTSNVAWNPPISFLNETTGFDNGIRVVDVNGDGLPDIIRGDTSMSTTTYSAWINNGNGWTSDATWNPPAAFLNEPSNTDNGLRIIDANGDGLPDLLQGINNDLSHPSNTLAAWINNGHGWTSNVAWNPPAFLTDWGNVSDNGVRLTDVNGDGLPDVLQGVNNHTNASDTYLAWTNNSNIHADLLTSIVYAQGASSTVTYTSATQDVDASGSVVNIEPYPVYVVSRMNQSDGTQNIATSTYSYSNGVYYFAGPYDKQFAGFATVSSTDAAGNVTKTFYHTGNGTDSTHGEYVDNFWKIGKPYRIEQYDNAGNLYKKTIDKWDHYALGGNAAFVKLTQSVTSDYDGLTSHKDSAETYTYDNATGNQIQKVQSGEVTGSDDGTFSDIGTDKFTTDISYVTSTTGVIGKPYDVTLTDQSSNKAKETRLYYDSLALGNASKGNLTKQEDWKTSSTYVNVQNTYNSLGLVTQHLDERGKATNYLYDVNNLYVATSTNALSQSTGYQYENALGKITRTIDPNGNNFRTTYDGLGRPLSVLQPDLDNPPSLTTSTAYIYTDTTNAVSVKESTYLAATSTVDTYRYYDGLNRLIQTRKSAEGAYKVADRTYNNLSLLQKESFPYFASGTVKTAATTTAALFTNYMYDALKRVLTIGNAVGTTTLAYTNWKTTTTDPRSKAKDVYDDAYGNLVQVDEHSGANINSTFYTYDGLRDLTKITDALGNIRNFTYDGLARKLTMQDLHAATDTTYGAWTYTYDDAGNMTQAVDPKNQTVNYTYDDTNRISTEDYTGQAGTELTYTYDTCTNGKTRLCTASSTDAITSSTYNGLGQLTAETKTIATTTYTTSYTYDRQGNQLTITNPDSSQVKYTYDAAGLQETVAYKANGGSFSNVVDNFDYSPTDQPATIAYTNGVTVTNTYDPAQIYRLTHKVGALPNSNKAQDITYTYDGVGNITQLIDASISGTGKTVNYIYDDLSRLTSATASNVSSSPSYTQTFLYDALGNILSGPAGTYSYAGSAGSNYANPDAVTNLTTSATITLRATSTVFSADASSTVATTTLNVVTSTLILVACKHGATFVPPTNVTDTIGNSFTLFGNASNTATGNLSSYWAISTKTNASDTISCNFASSVTFRDMLAIGYDGVDTGSPVDATSSRGTATNSIATSSQPLTTTNTNDVIVSFANAPHNLTSVDSPFTIRTASSSFGIGVADFITSSTQINSSATWHISITGDWIFTSGAFKAATVSSTSYTYDNNGNLINFGNATNTWNYRNQLTQSILANGTLSYIYDYQGSRVKLVESGATTIFPSKEYNISPGIATTTVKHIFADNLLVGTVTDTTASNGTSTITLHATSTVFSVSASSTQATTTLNVSTGTLILVACEHGTTFVTPTNVTDTIGNVFTLFSNASNTTTGNLATYYATSTATNASDTIACNFASSVKFRNMFAIGYDGIDQANPYEASAARGTAVISNATSSQPLSTINPNDIFTSFAFAGADNLRFVDGPFTIRTQSSTYSLGLADFITSSTQTNASATWHTNSASDWMFTTGAFRSAGGNTASTTVRYVLDDHLSGIGVVTDASGTVVETLDYYPFGAPRLDNKASGYSGEKRKYIGQEYDGATSLSYLNARYYNGSQGQFISQDPVFLGNPIAQDLKNPQSLNSYSYAGNNPVTYSDPTGKCAEDGCVGEAIVAGAAIGFVGGFVQQAISDALNRQLSSPSQYLSSALRGGAVGGSVAFGGAVELGALAVGAIGAGVSAVGNVIGNRATGQSNNWGSIAFEAGVTGVTGGFLEELPKVPGRYPKLFSDAFFAGEHTANTAAGGFFGVGASTFANTAASNYNSNQSYGGRTVPGTNSASTVQSYGGGGGTYDTRSGAFVLSGQNPSSKYSFSGGKNAYGESFSQVFSH
jgi:RHS repeat-associated protein